MATFWQGADAVGLMPGSPAHAASAPGSGHHATALIDCDEQAPVGKDLDGRLEAYPTTSSRSAA